MSFGVVLGEAGSTLGLGRLGKRSVEELLHIQQELAKHVKLEGKPRLERVAGVDEAFAGDWIISAVVVCNPCMEVLEVSMGVRKAEFPYVPGLLAWREGPAILDACLELSVKPDLLILNGCGINHPRFLGLASHMGLLLDACTVGVTQNLLCGKFEMPRKEGEATPIFYGNRQVGYALLSKRGCKPIFIAPGHKIGMEESLEVVKKCLRNHKLPEPLRLAHLRAAQLKSEFGN